MYCGTMPFSPLLWYYIPRIKSQLTHKRDFVIKFMRSAIGYKTKFMRVIRKHSEQIMERFGLCRGKRKIQLVSKTQNNSIVSVSSQIVSRNNFVLFSIFLILFYQRLTIVFITWSSLKEQETIEDLPGDLFLSFVLNKNLKIFNY